MINHPLCTSQEIILHWRKNEKEAVCGQAINFPAANHFYSFSCLKQAKADIEKSIKTSICSNCSEIHKKAGKPDLVSLEIT